MSRVGVFGEGSGATIALLASSVDPRIKAIDLLNPWGDWPSWLAASRLVPDSEQPDYLKPDFLKSIAPLDPINILPKLTQIPVRLQQNLWDSTRTPATSREHIAAALPANAELAQYKDERDYYERVGNNGKMLDWMDSALTPVPQLNATPAITPETHSQ
jgi:cephalosporin-C deacetylase-like acetyl esterase